MLSMSEAVERLHELGLDVSRETVRLWVKNGVMSAEPVTAGNRVIAWLFSDAELRRVARTREKWAEWPS